MFDLFEFLRNRLWVAFLILGAVCVFSSSIVYMPSHDWHFDARTPINLPTLSVGMFFMAFGALFFLLSEKLFSKVKIAGRWEYEVYTAEGKFSHKGDSKITQSGNDITVRGTRLFTCSGNDCSKNFNKVNIPWFTTWASVCSDNFMRFDYTIDIPNDKIAAICKINISEKKPTEMSGAYYLLPPFGNTILNCQYGQIKLKRIEDAYEILPPTTEDGEC